MYMLNINVVSKRESDYEIQEERADKVITSIRQTLTPSLAYCASVLPRRSFCAEYILT